MKRSFFLTPIAFAIFSLPVFCEVHIVAKGETLYSISRLYDISVADLCLQNNIQKDSVLQAGKKLLVNQKLDSSKTAYYTVKTGDTYYNISKRYDTDVASLLQLNGFGQERTLKAGEKILVPTVQKQTTTVSLPVLNKSKDTLATSLSLKQGDINLVWPFAAQKVSYIKTKISGVQITGKKDDTVTAIKAGNVMFCGLYRGYGQVIFVQAITGHIYVYIGLEETTVNKGDYVVFKDKLGKAAKDSKGSPCMTLMVFLNGKATDPAKAPRG